MLAQLAAIASHASRTLAELESPAAPNSAADPQHLRAEPTRAGGAPARADSLMR